MNIVDSSGWLEYFSGGSNAEYFLSPLEDPSSLIVPTITIYEVFKVVLCVFRRIVTTHSAGNCPPIPLHCDHPFRNIVTTHSAAL